MSRLLNILCSPFKKNFSFFLVLAILASIADVIAWMIYGEPIFAVYLGLHGFLMCYVIALIFNIIRYKLLRKIYAVVFISLGVISFLVDVVCHYTFHIGFSKDFVSVIMGTNLAESLEFANTFFTFEIFIIFVVTILILGVIYYYRNIINILGGKFAYLFLLISFIGTAAICVKNSKNWDGVYLYKIKTFFSYSAPVNLKEHLQNPSIENVGDGPKNIVLVIGESFSKRHSSLYGYKKNTNPILAKLEEDSLLFVYKNVTSAELTTIASFQSLMSTYRPEYKLEINWYDCVTLPEIISKTNYKSIWISNQSRDGMFDNIVSQYAELCDTTVWVGNKFAGLYKVDLDELVLQKIRNLKECFNDKNVFIVHLMGSHYSFKSRYPEKYNVFTPDGYEDFEKHQRLTLAEYDNSILYNDYIVSEICKLFETDETIVLYFSDHGLDVYDSDTNYVGHSRLIDSLSIKVGREIPFMIYASPKYQNNFPRRMDDIKHTQTKPFRTDDILYTIMDIMDVKFIDNDDVNKYSLLKY